MIKVLHILSSKSYSGAENATIELLSNLNKDFKTLYCSQDGDIKRYLDNKEIDYVLVEKVNRRNLKKVISNFNPDIIHAHDFKASLKVATINTKAQIISHLHHNPPWIKTINLKTIIYNMLSFRFDKIFIVSDAIKNEFKSTSKVKNKMLTVYNPINVEEIFEKSRETKITPKPDIVFVGRLTEAKGIPQLLEIYTRIIREKPDCKIQVIGSGSLEDMLIRGIQKNKLENNVSLLGYLENPYPHMRASKIMIMPSKWEGFGLAAAEAMLLGTPVIATPVGGLQEIVGNDNGLVCNSTDCFVNTSLKLLDDLKCYNQVSQDVSIRIQSKYNIDIYLKKIEKEYHKTYENYKS